MGSGVFSAEAYVALRSSKNYDAKSRDQIFTARTIDPEMDPTKVTFRESRDSEEHPLSLPIIVGLDVTGSMGMIPENIVKESLPDLVGTIIAKGENDPQVLFLGIGDFVYDRAPLQIGQFESSAELLDRWLTKVYLEGGGGGNNVESYTLAWLVAARHTRTDAWEKRQTKGFCITIGDEPVNQDIPSDVIKRLTSVPEARSISSADLLKEVEERYHVFHIHVLHNDYAGQVERQAGWRELLGERFILLKDYHDLSRTIAQIVIDHRKKGSEQKSGPGKPIEEML